MTGKLTKQDALIGAISWLDAIIVDPTELERHKEDIANDLRIYKEARNRGRDNFIGR